jgi:UDP-glucose:(heptosyl)LPS alpha-1,3-glucosyltransferase
MPEAVTQAVRERRQTGASEPAAGEVTIVAHDIGSVGGMERQLTELVLGLRALGHEVTVIARSCVLPADAGVRFHPVRGPARPLLLAYPWFMLLGSLAVARRRRGVVQATGAIVMNRVDVIAVHYCHQVGPAKPSRANWLFRLASRITGVLVKAGERLCFEANRTATFVCVSEGVAQEVREHYPRAAARVVTIQNGVDTEAFAPGARAEDARGLRDSLQIEDGRLVAAFVGSEWGRKGLEPAVRALACAPGWDLVVAGDGDRNLYQELADSLGVGAAVRWLGVSRDVAVLYELADALVFPTAYEAFPLVALEAAASGLPILATPVSGVRELIEDNVSGFLISRDPDTIATRLSRLAEDPDARKRMGEAARRSALQYSWTRMVARHHELYARLGSGRAPRS